MNINIIELLKEEKNLNKLKTLTKLGVVSPLNLVKSAIESNDAKLILNAALVIDSLDSNSLYLNDLAVAICNTSDLDAIYEFAIYTSNPPLELIAKKIVTFKEPNYIFALANAPKNIKDILTQGIIATNNAEWIYKFALNIPNVDLNKLATGVIATNNLDYICFFTKIPNAPINMLVQAIVKSHNAKAINELANYYQIDKKYFGYLTKGLINAEDSLYIKEFIEEIKYPASSRPNIINAACSSNSGDVIYSCAKKLEPITKEEMLKLALALSKTTDAYYIYTFALNINDPDNILAKALVKTKDYIKIYDYIAYIPDAPLDILVPGLIKTGQISYCIKAAIFIAKIYPDSKYLKEIEDFIINTNDADIIYNYALNVFCANKNRLAAKIIELNKAYYICVFAQKVKGAPISELAKAIILTNDAYYIYKFAEKVQNAPLDLLADALINLKAYDKLYYLALKTPNAPIAKIIIALANDFILNYDYLLELALCNINIRELYLSLNNPYLLSIVTRVNLEEQEKEHEQELKNKNASYLDIMQIKLNTLNKEELKIVLDRLVAYKEEKTILTNKDLFSEIYLDEESKIKR